MYLSTLKRPNTFEMVKLQANKFGMYACLKALRTVEPPSIWNRRNQTVDLPLCTAYTVHLHHTFALTLE